MLKVLVISFAQIVQTGLPSAVRLKRFFGHSPLQANRKSHSLHWVGSDWYFIVPKLCCRSLCIISTKSLAIDISQFIFREYEVVTRVYVSVEFHNAGMSAMLRHCTYARLLAHPVSQCGIEYLYEEFAHIFFYPFIKNCTEKVTPLFRTYGKISQCPFFTFCQRGKMTTVLM